MQSTADTSIKYSPHRIESSAVDPIINEHLLRDQAADYDRRVAEAELRGMERCAQTAFDTTSDDPQPGNWNDACEHIYDLIRAEIARLRAEMDQPSDALAGKEGKS